MTTKKESEKITISIFDFILAVAKHKKSIFIITLCGAIFALVFSIGSLLLQKYRGPKHSYYPNIYRLTATILFSQDKSVASLDISSLIASPKLGQNRKINLVERLLRSSTILDQLIDEFNLVEFFNISPKNKFPRQTCYEKLKKSFLVKTTSDIDIVDISYTHYDPEFCEKILNRAIDLLEGQYKNLSIEHAQKANALVTNQIKDVETRLNEKFLELMKFQDQNNTIDPNRDLEEKARMVTNLELEAQKRNFFRQEVAAYKGWNDPQVQQISNEIKQLEKQVNSLIYGSSANSKFNIPITKLMTLSKEFASIKKEITLLENLYVSLMVQYYSNEKESNYTQDSFQVIERPNFFSSLSEDEIPTEYPKKFKPSRVRFCIIITFIFFFIGVLFAITKEFLTAYNDTQEGSVKLYQLKKNLSLKKNK